LIEDIIHKHVTSGKSPGIAVGLIDENGTRTFNYGKIEKNSDIAPTSDTVFEIGSVTKLFTSILLAKLQREGLLSINDPITKFLPELQTNPEFNKRQINLIHLATHTSGLPDMSSRILTPIMFDTYLLPTEQTRSHNILSRFNKSELFQYVLKIKLKGVPGNRWSYSSIGVVLLANVLERVTSTSYEELVKNHICEPLNMKDTGIDLLETHKNRLAVGYSYLGKRRKPSIAPAIESAAGLRSTVSDMLKFLSANLGLSESSLDPELKYCQLTRTNVNISYLMRLILTSWVNVKLDEMALGWWVTKLEKEEILHHAGGTLGFVSFVGMNAKDKSGVVILSNQISRLLPKLGLDLLKEMNTAKF